MNTIKKGFLKYSGLLVLLVLCFENTYSQSAFNIAVGGQFQLATLKSDSDFFSDSTDSGAGVNLGISYSLNENWSIHSGAGLIYIQSRNILSSLSDSYSAQDIEGETFEFRYTLNNYIEKQKNTVVSIPFAVQYESSGVTRFYSKLGASIHLFVDSKSSARAEELSTSGFFERFNGEINAPSFAGFGTFDEIEFSEQELALNSSINAFVEIGVKQKLEKNHWIYIGFFVEYGLNNIIESEDSSLIEYNSTNPTDFTVNSSLNARNQNTGEQFIDKLRLNTVGIRLTYEFKGL